MQRILARRQWLIDGLIAPYRARTPIAIFPPETYSCSRRPIRRNPAKRPLTATVMVQIRTAAARTGPMRGRSIQAEPRR